jgi:hypothetical protein
MTDSELEQLAMLGGKMNGAEGDIILFSLCAYESKNYSSYYEDMEAIRQFIKSTDLHFHIMNKLNNIR